MEGQLEGGHANKDNKANGCIENIHFLAFGIEHIYMS
jgi:hypothetical protein